MNKLVIFIIIINLIYQKKSYQKSTFLQKKYLGLIHFIHEYHHFLEINIDNEDIDNNILSNTNKAPLYCVTHNANNFHKKSGIYNILETLFHKKHINQQEIILQKLKFYLSGYAAEVAYKNHFSLLNFYNINYMSYYQKDFLLFLYYHYFYQKIHDISNALSITNNVDYNAPEIAYYINKYKNSVLKNHCLKYINNFHINSNQIILLYGIYHELIEKYSQHYYYEKFYRIIKNNPEIFTMEIFFLNDLKSLWKNEKLSRNITNLTNYEKNEIQIIQNIKSIDSFQKRKDLYFIYANNIDYESLFCHYQNIIKIKIRKTIQLLHKKKQTFFNTIKNFFL